MVPRAARVRTNSGRLTLCSWRAGLVRSWAALARQPACLVGKARLWGPDRKQARSSHAGRTQAAPDPHQLSWGHKLPQKPWFSGGWWPEWTASYHSSSQRQETLQTPHSSTGFYATCPREAGDSGDRQPHLMGGLELRVTSTRHIGS